jgi:predicted Zn-dependent protease
VIARFLGATGIAILCAGCVVAVDGPRLFGPEVRHVVVRVAYAPSVPPIVDGGAFVPLSAAFTRLFDGTGKTVTFPTTLDEMVAAPELTPGDYAMDDAVRVVQRLERDDVAADDTYVITVVYLPGGLTEDDGILYGLTRSASHAVAVTAGRIRADTAFPAGSSELERAVVLHELGHAVGLVDSGLPMATDHLHRDARDPGGHCSNPACVMSVDFGDAPHVFYAGTSPLGLFGDECLADIAAVVRR